VSRTGKQLSVNGLQQLCIRLEQKSGVHCNPHKFRRFFATWWINQTDANIDVLMEIGGWQSREVLYSHYASYQTAKLVNEHRLCSPLRVS
jgi:integrase